MSTENSTQEIAGYDHSIFLERLEDLRKKAKISRKRLAEELDLKKCAAVSGNKSMEMIHVRELLPATGYIRGGCSPIGMKKKYPTFVDETAMLFDAVAVSAGQRGVQVMLNPDDLLKAAQAKYESLTRD